MHSGFLHRPLRTIGPYALVPFLRANRDINLAPSTFVGWVVNDLPPGISERYARARVAGWP